MPGGDFYPVAGHEFAVEVVAPLDEETAGSFDVFFLAAGGIHLEVNLLERTASLNCFCS